MRSILIGSATLIFLTLFSTLASGKDVFQSSQLGPYDFQSSILSTTGAIFDILDQSSTESSVELVDPVIAGIRLSGKITSDAVMTSNGPATWLSIDLITLDSTFVQLAFVDVVSEVTYNIAAFGSAPEARIRIAASGIKNSERNVVGLLTRASASAVANIELYETDAQGNRANLLQLWQPYNPADNPGNSADDELSFTDFNQSFSIETNQLYEVVVKSSSRIRLSNISDFALVSYASMSADFQSTTEGVTMAVSSFSDPSAIISSPPSLATSRADLLSTQAIISGGVRLAGTTEFSDSFSVGDTIAIDSTLRPDPEDIGKRALAYVIVSSDTGQYQLTADGLAEFDGSEASLNAFSEVTLRADTHLNIVQPFGSQLTLQDGSIGKYKFYVGYSTDGGAITYTRDPIILNVDGL